MDNRKRPLLKPIAVSLLIAAAIVWSVNHFHIKDFCVIEPAVLYTSGQPRGMDYPRLLYRYHIAAIVNIRPPSEHREQNWYNQEIVWARNNGVRYIEMPIEKSSYFPDKQTQKNFIDIMSSRDNLPVLLHGSGDDKRVAMLVAAWARRSRGYTAKETIRVVKKIIDDRELTEKETDFINRLAR